MTTASSLLRLSATLASYSFQMENDHPIITQLDREKALLMLADNGKSLRWAPEPMDALALLDLLSEDLDEREDCETDAVAGAIL